jgi:4-amino-4-deoxy-L-arabinose transferase-like glycosyltransferase
MARSRLGHDGTRGTRTRRHRAWRSWHLIPPLIVLLLGCGIRLTSIRPPNQTPDEDFYTFCGEGVRTQGTHFLPGFIQACWENRQTPEYPWPTRIGYFWLIAASMTATDDTSVNAGAAMSTLASLLVLVLTGWLAIRFLDAWSATIGLLFLATSPLDLAIAGRTWQDEVVALLAILMTHAYIRWVTRPERAQWAIAFFALGACALTVKENMVLVLAAGTFGMLWAAWRSGRGARAAALIVAGALAATLVAGGFIMWSSGGVEPLRKSYQLWTLVKVPNDYMRTYQMGSPAYYAVGLSILNAVPFALGLTSAILIAFRVPLMRSPWRGPEAATLLGALAWFVLAYGLIACVYSQKNLRFLSPIFAPVFVLAAALVRAVVVAIRGRLPANAFRGVVALAVAALVVSAAADLARFHHWFIEKKVPDLATPWFTK